MRTVDHAIFSVRVGKNILRIQNPIKLAAFTLGNVFPDFCYHTYRKSFGHGFKTARKKLAAVWRCGQRCHDGAFFYFRLGVAAHYVCDSFTFAHNVRFGGTLREHIRYENRLHRVAVGAFGKIGGAFELLATPADCMRYLERAHRIYANFSDGTPEQDTCWIIAVGRTVLLSTLSFSKNGKVSQNVNFTAQA